MGGKDEFDRQDRVINNLSGEVHGPVGQFGTVHGDVSMVSYHHRDDSARLAGAMEEALARRELSREWEAREQERQREAASRQTIARRSLGCGSAVVLFFPASAFVSLFTDSVDAIVPLALLVAAVGYVWLVLPASRTKPSFVAALLISAFMVVCGVMSGDPKWFVLAVLLPVILGFRWKVRDF